MNLGRALPVVAACKWAGGRTECKGGERWGEVACLTTYLERLLLFQHVVGT